MAPLLYNKFDEITFGIIPQCLVVFLVHGFILAYNYVNER